MGPRSLDHPNDQSQRMSVFLVFSSFWAFIPRYPEYRNVGLIHPNVGLIHKTFRNSFGPTWLIIKPFNSLDERDNWCQSRLVPSLKRSITSQDFFHLIWGYLKALNFVALASLASLQNTFLGKQSKANLALINQSWEPSKHADPTLRCTCTLLTFLISGKIDQSPN
jgi:hypothetical protein